MRAHLIKHISLLLCGLVAGGLALMATPSVQGEEPAKELRLIPGKEGKQALAQVHKPGQEQTQGKGMGSDTEELLRAYGATDEFFEMQQQMDDILAQSEKTQEQQKRITLLILILSVGVALVPPVAVGKMIAKQPKEERNLAGSAASLAIAVAGGAVLFGINYGWMSLRLKAGDALNAPMAILITLALAGAAIFLLTKKDRK